MSLRQRNVQSSDRTSNQGPVINTQPGQPIGDGQYGPAYQNVSLGQQVWMPRPSRLGNCPAGLEYLTQIDQILVKQQVELLEVFTSWQGRNSYRLLNSVGQQVYFAKEESNVCERQIFGTNRSFAMHIIDNIGTEVMTVYKDFRCISHRWCACCEGCAQRLTIEAPPGHVVGYVKQRVSFCSPYYTILDSGENEIFNIVGPCHIGIVGGLPCNQDFTIYSATDEQTVMGTIQKQWGNLLKEVFTTADDFGVSFPMDLDVRMKAVIIGATFLIDFMHFEAPCKCGSKD